MLFRRADASAAEAAGDYLISDVLKEHGIVSLANVPILIDGAAWGVLEVDSSTKCDFGEDTIDFLMAAAAIIGPIVQRRGFDRSEAEAAAAAAAQVQAREVLLREMQHRVKQTTFSSSWRRPPSRSAASSIPT